MVDSYPMNHCPHGKSLQEHCDACEKVDLAERHQQEHVVQLEAQVTGLLETVKALLYVMEMQEDISQDVAWHIWSEAKDKAASAIARAEGKAE